MLAIVDMDNHSLVEMEGKKLVGECNFCGVCCRGDKVPFPKDEGPDCKYLTKELYEGEDRYVCSIYFRRPIGCALWPEPDDEMPEECCFRWEAK
jgi:Fe-S-cluster containining protein